MSLVIKVNFWHKHLQLSEIEKEYKNFSGEMIENKSLVIRKKSYYLFLHIAVVTLIDQDDFLKMLLLTFSLISFLHLTVNLTFSLKSG